MILNSCFETPLKVIFLITRQTYLESLEERTRKSSPAHPIIFNSIQVHAVTTLQMHVGFVINL